VVVKLKVQPPPVDDDDLEFPNGTFEIVEILKGGEFLMKGTEIMTVLIGNHEIGDQFMVMGVDPPSIAWSTPIRTSDRVVKYFHKIPSLPAAGVDRLAFFMNYFEDEETVLAADAYDEFAIAPYEDVLALKDRIDHDKLVGFLKDEDVLESRKRLYFTILGVCGTKDDIPFLESMLQEEDREKRPGLDAMVACYLRIRGPEGLPFIEELFLANKEAEYIDVFSVIQALRFHTTESDVISKERVAQAMRLVLDHPKIADIVIPDLSRLQDWSVQDRLAGMFRDAAGETKWVRTPIASYMFECPGDNAEALVKEFREIDADAVNRAELMANFDAFDDLDLDDDDEVSGEESDDESGKGGVGAGVDSDGDTGDGNTGDGDTGDGDTGDGDSGSKDSVDDSLTVLNVNANQIDDESFFVSVDAPTVANSDVGEKTSVNRVSNGTSTTSKTSLAQNAPSAAPLAAVSSPLHWSVVIGASLLVSLTLFALLWSVINGWFERLIF